MQLSTPLSSADASSTLPLFPGDCAISADWMSPTPADPAATPAAGATGTDAFAQLFPALGASATAPATDGKLDVSPLAPTTAPGGIVPAVLTPAPAVPSPIWLGTAVPRPTSLQCSTATDAGPATASPAGANVDPSVTTTTETAEHTDTPATPLPSKRPTAAPLRERARRIDTATTTEAAPVQVNVPQAPVPVAVNPLLLPLSPTPTSGATDVTPAASESDETSADLSSVETSAPASSSPAPTVSFPSQMEAGQVDANVVPATNLARGTEVSAASQRAPRGARFATDARAIATPVSSSDDTLPKPAVASVVRPARSSTATPLATAESVSDSATPAVEFAVTKGSANVAPVSVAGTQSSLSARRSPEQRSPAVSATPAAELAPRVMDRLAERVARLASVRADTSVSDSVASSQPTTAETSMPELASISITTSRELGFSQARPTVGDQSAPLDVARAFGATAQPASRTAVTAGEQRESAFNTASPVPTAPADVLAQSQPALPLMPTQSLTPATAPEATTTILSPTESVRITVENDSSENASESDDLTTAPTASGAARKSLGSRGAKFAEARDESAASEISSNSPADKKILSVSNKRVAATESDLGTSVARSAAVMSTATSRRPTTSESEQGRFVPSAQSPADFSAPDFASLPLLPQAAASAAHRAVDTVMSTAERFASGTHNAVNLQFSLAGVDLAVRVEMRDGEVRATFRTDSNELRAALATEWQSVNAGVADRTLRLGDPVFTHAAASSSTSLAGDGASQQQQRDPGSRQAPSAEFFESRFPRSGLAAAATAAVSDSVATPRLSALNTPLRLHTFA